MISLQFCNLLNNDHNKGKRRENNLAYHSRTRLRCDCRLARSCLEERDEQVTFYELDRLLPTLIQFHRCHCFVPPRPYFRHFLGRAVDAVPRLGSGY